MKNILLLILLVITLHKSFSQQSDFIFEKIKYEYELKKTESSQFQFSICKSDTDPKTGKTHCDKIFSSPLSKSLDEGVFEAEFNNVMLELDSLNNYTILVEPAKTKYESLRKMFYEKAKTIAEEKPKATALDDSIPKKVAELFKENSNRKAIGYFKLKDSTTAVKIKIDTATDKEQIKIADIENIEIVLSNGGIRKKGIKVLLKDGRVFRNDKAPVTLYRLDKRKNDALICDDKRKSQKCYIELGDLFNYVYLGKFNYPADGVAYISPNKPVDSLAVGSSISELLDVSIYSDLLALLGRKPNGIIQTQITGTFITNTSNIPNTDFTFHNFIKPYFRLAKFDSKYSQLDSSNFKIGGKDSIINRLYLNQVAYLQAGLKTNIIRIGVGNNQQIFLNAGAEISLTNADSLLKKDIVTINYYPEIEYNINRLDNFGLECSLKYIRQCAPKNSPYTNKKGIWIFNPQVTLYYYPFSNPNNKIYVRYNHFAQIGDASYNYPQFQFGFKTNLFGNKETN